LALLSPILSKISQTCFSLFHANTMHLALAWHRVQHAAAVLVVVPFFPPTLPAPSFTPGLSSHCGREEAANPLPSSSAAVASRRVALPRRSEQAGGDTIRWQGLDFRGPEMHVATIKSPAGCGLRRVRAVCRSASASAVNPAAPTIGST
jgi:hypothetical protein